jgi:tRNA-2-methylthio-N6-dimethylallyladenosine synthase
MVTQTKKYHLVTYGCQMNKSDSERIEGVLLKLGWEKAEKPEEANLVIINTCSVRQTAEDRVFGQLNNLFKLKQEKTKMNQKFLIAVTGCLVGRDKKREFKRKFPEVDFWFPISELPQLPKMLKEKKELAIPSSGQYLSLKPHLKNNFQAFVPISTGCSQFCSYCIVPYARGLEQFRPLKEILEEINQLAKNGCLEVTLLGQIVNHYQAPDPENFSPHNPFLKHNHFAALLWEINQIPGLQWIHFTSPHPLYLTDEVIEALTLPKQINYLHLPLQSGDNEILKRMNRGYTREFYLNLIKKIRKRKPTIALGTDIIVGFSGETKKQFQNTVNLYQQIEFDIAYLAMYSPRPGTLAYKKFPDDIPHSEKKRRWKVLEQLMEKITLKKNQKFIGKKVEVLGEELLSTNNSLFNISNSKTLKGQFSYLGHSKEMKQVRFLGPTGLVGKIVKVKICEALTWELRGIAQKED